MSIDALFEDENILVLDKPAGIAMHPGNMKGSEVTVVDFVRDKVGDPDTQRPGIVHRLDKDTSGVVVIAKNVETKEYLQQQFKQRRVEKYYMTAVSGHLKHEHARIDVPIGRHPKNPLRRAARSSGRPALSEYWVQEVTTGFSLLKVRIYTGRTHQIRIHLAHLGHPVLGDRLYGKPVTGLDRQFLHASELKFTGMDSKPMRFSSPLPVTLAQFWYNAQQT